MDTHRTTAYLAHLPLFVHVALVAYEVESGVPFSFSPPPFVLPPPSLLPHYEQLPVGKSGLDSGFVFLQNHSPCHVVLSPFGVAAFGKWAPSVECSSMGTHMHKDTMQTSHVGKFSKCTQTSDI